MESKKKKKGLFVWYILKEIHRYKLLWLGYIIMQHYSDKLAQLNEITLEMKNWKNSFYIRKLTGNFVVCKVTSTNCNCNTANYFEALVGSLFLCNIFYNLLP